MVTDKERIHWLVMKMLARSHAIILRVLRVLSQQQLVAMNQEIYLIFSLKGEILKICENLNLTK